MRKKLITGTIAVLFLLGISVINSLPAYAEGNVPGNSQNAIEEPVLIPGDFFYFTKIIFEKVELLLTFNDTKKAEALLNFAKERVKEAAALSKQGKTELANETLQNALKEQNKSFEVIQATKDAKSDNEPKREILNNISFEGQNIIALAKELEKTSNPQEIEAIEKNIISAFEQLKTKIDKTEKRNKDEGQQVDENDGQQIHKDDGQQVDENDGQQIHKDDGQQVDENDGQQIHKDDGQQDDENDGQQIHKDDGQQDDENDGQQLNKDDGQQVDENDGQQLNKDDGQQVDENDGQKTENE